MSETLPLLAGMLSTRRAEVKEEKKNPHNIFHMEKIMETNNTKKEIMDKSLEGDTSHFHDEWTFRTWNRKKASSQISSKKSRINS